MVAMGVVAFLGVKCSTVKVILLGVGSLTLACFMVKEILLEVGSLSPAYLMGKRILLGESKPSVEVQRVE